jgi:AcrR family transcriptional regulator
VPARRDALASRKALIDAAGELLVERGPVFGLSEVARRAAISTATTYRHFPDVRAALDAYYARAVQDLLAAVATVPRDLDAPERFARVCRVWVGRALVWGPALVHIRSAAGFLQRLRAGEPSITSLYRSLSSVLAGLIDDGLLPEQPLEYAVLMWITVFDERVIVDLDTGLGLAEADIAARLGHALRQILRTPASEPGLANPA